MTSPEPISIPREVFEALYPSVGELILQWSIVEQSLDHWVAIIYQSANGKTIEAEIPRALNRKIRFLRRCFKSIPELDSFAQEATDCLVIVEKLSEIRHTIIHGSLSEYSAETQLFKFVRFEIDKEDDIHVLKSEYLSIQEILEAGRLTLSLMNRTLTLSQSLIDALVR